MLDGSPRISSAIRVPQITALFWIVKALSTALGESASDYLVQLLDPVIAVGVGFVGFAIAISVQMTMRCYRPWAYWSAVVMVGVFGTMAADVAHVGLGIPYAATSGLYAVALAVVFLAWRRAEGTLSIHTVNTTRREVFYWAAVMATFALGTAVGDLTAFTLHLGYAPSAALYAVMIAIPAIGYRWRRWNPVLAFWSAYVLTRPLGASLADWTGKPPASGGLGWGSGPVGLVLVVLIVVAVAHFTVTGSDAPGERTTRR